MKTIRTWSTLLAATAITLPLAAPAHAGYDVDNNRATGSYSSNRAMRNAARGGRATAVYGTYVTTRTSGMVTLVGTLIEDADDKNFDIRDSWGRTYNVETSNYARADAANKLQKGDMVRVYGEWKDNMLHATNVRTMPGSSIALGTRVQYQSRYYTVGAMNAIEGTLVGDADDDEFEINATNGQKYMIRTRLIPDSAGANKLQEGDRVRVYGYWIAEADGKEPQLEALNFRAM